MNKRGELTQEMRRRLRARRRQIGWSFRKASDYFGVEVSTYRKWESGKTASILSEKRLELFQVFINEEYPQGWDNVHFCNRSWNDQTELERCLLLVSKTYSLLSWEKLLVEHYTNCLKGTLRQVMELYLDGDSPARHNSRDE